MRDALALKRRAKLEAAGTGILAALAAGPARRASFPGNEAIVDAALRLLQKTGRITKVGRGLWALTEASPRPRDSSRPG